MSLSCGRRRGNWGELRGFKGRNSHEPIDRTRRRALAQRTTRPKFMVSRTASCHCGTVELRCHGSPRKISMCHCLDCQRRTGSAFSVAVFYLRDMIAVQRGITNSFERDSASGFPVKFHFCVRCGSNVYWEPRRMPNIVGVALGAFADPKFPQPMQSVWTRDKHAWLVIPDDMTEFEVNPVSQPSKT